MKIPDIGPGILDLEVVTGIAKTAPDRERLTRERLEILDGDKLCGVRGL